MEIDAQVCTIRSWRREDRDGIVCHANDRDVWINLRDRFPYPYTSRDAEAWLDLVAQSTPETDFAIAVAGGVAGGVGIVLNDDVHRRSAEIGYWVGKAYWGRGIATAVVRAMTDWSFASFDLCRIYAGVFEWNQASARVLEKAGYLLEGRLHKSVTKDGRTIDQLLYATTR